MTQHTEDKPENFHLIRKSRTKAVCEFPQRVGKVATGQLAKVLWDKELETLTVEYETGWMLVVEMTQIKNQSKQTKYP